MTETQQLPAPIPTYLSAQERNDRETALATLSPDATVVDDGHTYRGHAEIGDWLSKAGSEFTYTSELTGVRRDGDAWIATHHLEGDFPGGVVDLHYRFALRDGLIEHLLIAP